MERDLWKAMVAALRVVPRRRPRNAVFDNRQVLAVYLWSVLHDRPVSWACQRDNWPSSAWRRALPDQSTMSRRLRDDALQSDLRTLLERVQKSMPEAATWIIDGKALVVPNRTSDPEASNGWASRGYGRGYKLHAVVTTSHQVVAFDVRPMHTAECVVAVELIDRVEQARGVTLLGDSAYDTNPLHAACASKDCVLRAPRRRPGTSISAGHRQHPARIEAIRAIERPNPPTILKERTSIERYFSRLAIAGGLYALPPFVRRLRRVRLWVAAKIVLNAARIRLQGAIRA